MSDFFGKTTDALASSINLRQIRHNVTAANIANAETPGYKAKKVDFEQALSRAIDINGLSKMNADHTDYYAVNGGAISKIRADVYDNPDVNISNDGNTVDLENEVATLNQNTILYKAALQLINKKLGNMRYAVTEGRR